MNVDLKVTDKNIRELESICGCCYCPCGKPRSVQVTCGFHSWRKQRGCVLYKNSQNNVIIIQSRMI